MVFVADDLGAWLTALLADAGRKWLITAALGTDLERALRRAATTAVQETAADLRPEGEDAANELAMVISQVFGDPLPGDPASGAETLLEALQAAIAAQLAPLDDRELTGTGQSSADLLGVPGSVLAQKLTGHLIQEIVVRGARGGALAPLASQINHDATHLQGQRIEDMVGGLTNAMRSALARLDAARTVAAAPTALAQLPAPVSGFTGRDGELAVLSTLLDPAGEAGPVVVSAVAGLAGVGKTTLAVEAGRAAAQQGWFGGGVLFLDLHGYDDVPVEPAQALDALLRALGVRAEDIPPDEEQRAALFRSRMAEIGSPVLVIADNASSEAQVRPLLPGTGPHKVMVTSRHTLAGLGARLVDVTVLDQAAATALLDAALRAARPEDGRITREAEAAARLAGMCGGLPLALQITAALLKADPALSAADLAQELAAESGRLEQLTYDDGSGPNASVAFAFELSYRRLAEIPARVFRLLPVSPGPDVSTAAVAVLADLPSGQARRVLSGLAQAHLAEAAPGAAGRWRMHDLVRLYARRLSDQHAEADRREPARDRLLRYYERMVEAADIHMRALPGTQVPDEFTDRDAALEWLDAERPTLVAMVTMAAGSGRDETAAYVPLNLGEYLDWRRRFDDKLAITYASLKATRRLGNRLLEAMALNNLGLTLQHLRRFEEAIAAGQQSVGIDREIGDRQREGIALTNLGGALLGARRFKKAIATCRAAAAIFREIGDRNREAMTLNNLGGALIEADRPEEAVAACQDAAAIFRQTGDRNREAGALTNLVTGLKETGRIDEAIAAGQEAVAIFRQTGDRNGQALVLASLGQALEAAGRFGEAVTAARDAADVFRRNEDRNGEAGALVILGDALWGAGQREEAIAVIRKAVAAYRETGDRHGEGIALGILEEVSPEP
jgi:tetratricopeptide (TPR) repeat protein